MDTQHFENSTLSAPNHSSRCTSGTSFDFGYDNSTEVDDTVAGIGSSSKECVLEPDYFPILHAPKIEHIPKTEHIRSVHGKYHCNLCPKKFIRASNLRRHRLLIHSKEGPFVCTICGQTFARKFMQTCHERLHSSEKKLVCRGELSAQPARAWGCGHQFAGAAALAYHFNSPGNVGRACIMTLLDKAYGKGKPIYTFPSVLLTQYPALKDFKLLPISALQKAPTEGGRSSSSDDSGYASYLDCLEPLSSLPYQAEAQTEGPQKAVSYHGSYSSLDSQVMPFPPSKNLRDPTDALTLLPERPETSEGSDGGVELLGLQLYSQGTSDSEGRSNYKVRHVSETNSFAQEKARTKDGNGHLSDSLSPDQSSSNSGSENEHDDISEASILDSSQRALIARLMDEICSSFFYQISHRPRQRGQEEQGSRETSSSSTEQTVTTKSFIDELHGSRKRRSHKEDEDPEDEDDGKYKRPRNQNTDDDHSKRARHFACPFHKFDASTYSSGNADPRVGLKYRSCGPPGWPNMGKLKEHLYRNHQTPIHCPRCWRIEKTEAALGEHARAKNQCDVLPPPLRWIPREVCEKLKNRKKAFAGQTEEDTWRYIFGLLFPDCPEVPSPYYNDGTTLEGKTQRNSPTSNAVAAYEEYARAHLPRLFEEALETAVAEQMQPIEEDLLRSLPGMVRDCLPRLAQNFLRHRSSNVSSIGGAGLQAEVLPSFFIEPLNLAEDIISINPAQVSTNGRDRLQPHSDSGYASVDTSFIGTSSGDLADLQLQNNIGSLHDSTSHGIDINGGSDFMPGSSDWAALMENNQDNNFLGNEFCDEFI